MCPYCGQKSVYRERVRVPRSDTAPAPMASEAPGYDEKKAWVCENAKCNRRFDVA
jgi:hypothetical protein